jgi:hypothetical protein
MGDDVAAAYFITQAPLFSENGNGVIVGSELRDHLKDLATLLLCAGEGFLL